MIGPLAMLLAGCTYTVHLQSRPSPALVELPDGRRLVTPVEVRLRYHPLRRDKATLHASGYRPLEVELRRLRMRTGRAFSGQRGELEVVLVPAHGPSGTWTIDDVPR